MKKAHLKLKKCTEKLNIHIEGQFCTYIGRSALEKVYPFLLFCYFVNPAHIRLYFVVGFDVIVNTNYLDLQRKDVEETNLKF